MYPINEGLLTVGSNQAQDSCFLLNMFSSSINKGREPCEINMSTILLLNIPQWSEFIRPFGESVHNLSSQKCKTVIPAQISRILGLIWVVLVAQNVMRRFKLHPF